MAQTDVLHGDCVWTGAEMARDPRWVKSLPPALLAQLDAALAGVQHLDWRRVGRTNFPLPAAAALPDEVRDELENGSGLVSLRGVDVARYGEDDLRRIWVALGCHLGSPMFQNCRGEDHGRTAFEDEAASGRDRLLLHRSLSVPNSRAPHEDHAVPWGDVGAGKPRDGNAHPAVAIA